MSAWLIVTALGPEQAPNPTYFCRRNLETPYHSPRGQRAVGTAHSGRTMTEISLSSMI